MRKHTQKLQLCIYYIFSINLNISFMPVCHSHWDKIRTALNLPALKSMSSVVFSNFSKIF